MIRGGFLSEEDRNKLIALARDGSAASRVTRRANTLVLRALHKPHVITYRREERKKFVELLSTRVPVKLSQLMDNENAAAAVRAALALESDSK